MKKNSTKLIGIILLSYSIVTLTSDDTSGQVITPDVTHLTREEVAALIDQEKLSIKDVFDGIYHTNLWASPESISGGGSTLAATATLRDMLPRFLKKYDIITLIDAPCGDFHWMQKVDLGSTYYIGVDIVEAMIKKNQLLYGDTNHAFVCSDITTHLLPKGDMILCRDCFQHLSYEQIFKALKLFKKSGTIYLLATTYKTTKKNHDIRTGNTCLYNLELPPFNFPRPIRLIQETSDDGYKMAGYSKKSLGLWKLDSIPV